METRKIENQFREDEIALIRHFDKHRQEWVINVYPKIGGRLRLAHEENEALSIETDVIKYDENIAVVCAVSTTVKGSFKGIGMASVERDQKIAPAILELAETRAIARSLRFAGYGVEYCSAEEVSRLEIGYHDKGSNGIERHQKGGNFSAGGNKNRNPKPDNGNGKSRLSNRQYRYILHLQEGKGGTKADLNQQCLQNYGTVAQHLSKADASSVIEQLLAH